MNKNVRALFVFCTISLFTASLNMIPLSMYFSSVLGITRGWALYLFLSKGPSVFFAGYIARLAEKYGLERMVAFSQLSAGVAFCTAAAGAFGGVDLITYLGLAAGFLFSAPLLALLPAFLQDYSFDRDLSTHLSHWQMARHIALLGAIALGGIMHGRFPLSLFLLLNGLGYFAGAFGWGPFIHDRGYRVPSQVTFWARSGIWFNRLNLANFVREIEYGILNPLLAQRILERFSAGTSKLGLLYFCIGLSVVLGAFACKYWGVGFSSIVSTLIIETLALGAAVMAPALTPFFAATLIAAFFLSTGEIGLQSNFLEREGRAFSRKTSAVYEATSNLGLILGYFVSGYVIPPQETGLTLVVFALLCVISLSLTVFGFSANAKNLGSAS